MNRPFSRHTPPQPQYRVNGRIRAREVRVIGTDSQQIGVLDLAAAIKLALQHGVDLVEIAPNAVPPVCRLVDFGKFKYEQAKKERESKKHQHANQVKEIQLTPRIDPHDLQIKREHATDFLCEDMKVKLNLRFKGREMAHTEIGFQVVNKFLSDIAPWGHPDNPPKLTGRTINVMVSPQPKNKRAKHPKQDADGDAPKSATNRSDDDSDGESGGGKSAKPSAPSGGAGSTGTGGRISTNAAVEGDSTINNAFANLNLPATESKSADPAP